MPKKDRSWFAGSASYRRVRQAGQWRALIGCCMANTTGQLHALTGYLYGQHRKPVARSNWLSWPTPQTVSCPYAAHGCTKASLIYIANPPKASITVWTLFLCYSNTLLIRSKETLTKIVSRVLENSKAIVFFCLQYVETFWQMYKVGSNSDL